MFEDQTSAVLEVLETALEPISVLMDDKQITEIMVNADGRVWVEKRGELTNSGIEMTENHRSQALMALAKHGGKYAQARTAGAIVTSSMEGFRFAGALYPIAPRGSTLCIRKHADPASRLSLEQLVEYGSVKQWQADYLLEQIITEQKNTLFVGKTSSGKTTLANAVLSALPDTERVCVIEDAKELAIKVPNCNSYLINADEGQTAAELIKLALRERYDRLIIGESRGNETFDLIKAFSSGHPGSVSTIHGNSAKKGLFALEMMYQMSLPEGAVVPVADSRVYIAAAIEMLVYCERRYVTGEDGIPKSVRSVKEIIVIKGVRNGEYEIETIDE